MHAANLDIEIDTLDCFSVVRMLAHAWQLRLGWMCEQAWAEARGIRSIRRRSENHPVELNQIRVRAAARHLVKTSTYAIPASIIVKDKSGNIEPERYPAPPASLFTAQLYDEIAERAILFLRRRSEFRMRSERTQRLHEP